MRKYGIDNFTFEVIKTVEMEDKNVLNELLCELEKQYIKKQKTRIRVKMCNVDGECIKKFESIKESVRWLKNNTKYSGDQKTIKQALDTNKIKYGFLWFKIENESVETNEPIIK